MTLSSLPTAHLDNTLAMCHIEEYHWLCGHEALSPIKRCTRAGPNMPACRSIETDPMTFFQQNCINCRKASTRRAPMGPRYHHGVAMALKPQGPPLQTQSARFNQMVLFFGARRPATYPGQPYAERPFVLAYGVVFVPR